MSDKEKFSAEELDQVSGGFKIQDGPFYFEGSPGEWESIGKKEYEEFKKHRPKGPPPPPHGEPGGHHHSPHGDPEGQYYHPFDYDNRRWY